MRMLWFSPVQFKSYILRTRARTLLVNGLQSSFGSDLDCDRLEQRTRAEPTCEPNDGPQPRHRIPTWRVCTITNAPIAQHPQNAT